MDDEAENSIDRFPTSSVETPCGYSRDGLVLHQGNRISGILQGTVASVATTTFTLTCIHLLSPRFFDHLFDLLVSRSALPLFRPGTIGYLPEALMLVAIPLAALNALVSIFLVRRADRVSGSGQHVRTGLAGTLSVFFLASSVFMGFEISSLAGICSALVSSLFVYLVYWGSGVCREPQGGQPPPERRDLFGYASLFWFIALVGIMILNYGFYFYAQRLERAPFWFPHFFAGVLGSTAPLLFYTLFIRDRRIEQLENRIQSLEAKIVSDQKSLPDSS